MLELVNRSVTAFGYMLSGNRTVSDDNDGHDKGNHNMTESLDDLIKSVNSTTSMNVQHPDRQPDMTNETSKPIMLIFMIGFK